MYVGSDVYRKWRFSMHVGRALGANLKDRLTKEIAFWDHRAEQLKAQ